jgi:putative Holliday junction resolvase
MKILALDVGDVRIGVAVSDELEMGAYPVLTYRRVGSLKRDAAAIGHIIAEQEADAILVGLPTSLDGGEGAQAKKTRVFGNALAKICGVPISYWDESLTSVEAEELLISMDYSRQKRKSVLDQWAAKILLDSYLDHRKAVNSKRDELS